MKQFGKLLLVTLGFGILTAVLSFVTSGPVGAQFPVLPDSVNVKVVNTPLPVSLQGTGNITGSVSITNAATSPALMRDVDNPARHAFERSFSCTASTDVACTDNFFVPAGQRLVIEYVSAVVILPPGQKGLFRVTTIVQSDTPLTHHILLSTQGDLLVASTPTRLYADPGTRINFVAVRDTPGAITLRGTISGYLVNCGAGTGCPLP